MFSQFYNSLVGYKKGFRFLSDNKLWKYAVLPGLLNLIIFVLFAYFSWTYSVYFSDYLMSVFHIKSELINDFLFVLIVVISRILSFVFMFLIYKYLILILYTPVLAFMAEKIYEIRTNNKIPFRFSTFINNIFRGISLSIKNLFKELFLTLLCTLLGFTVVLSPFVPVLIFIIQSYFYGFSMLDYQLEIKGYTTKKSAEIVWKNKGFVVGNGLIFNLLLLIPIIGVIVAPIWALAAAFELEV